ncbi:hypothetical protein BDQ12DRAFT_673379 [Crucibulum laeve]|uniref:F-box domain-containing protein n=1 Tax=Crucibulum laeve TaxID=68775 RepID=A0A5C3MJY4_9AGAR|nr:hypothetical protein BDQ12DRAFT_673379 [Crucibulum laeve]
MATSTFVPTLPDDVVLSIMGHLSPHEISCLRLVSKHVYDLSFERSVWVSVYKNSINSLFLPKGPMPCQTALELERILLHATKFEWNWYSATPYPCARRAISNSGIIYHSVLMEGPYLILGGTASFKIYNLGNPSGWSRPIVDYTETSGSTLSTFVQYETSEDTSHGAGSFFLAVRKQGVAQARSVVLWQIMPSGEFPLCMLADLPQPRGAKLDIRLGQDHLLIVSHQISHSNVSVSVNVLYAIHTKRMYTIVANSDAQDRLGNRPFVQYVFTPSFLLAISTTPGGTKTFFEAYKLPSDLDSPSNSGILVRTHSGLLEANFKEPYLVEQRQYPSHSKPGLETSITFAAVSHQPRGGLRLFRVILVPYGATEFISYPDYEMDHPSVPFNLTVTAFGTGTARGISMTDTMFQNEHLNCVATYDIRLNDGSAPAADVIVRSLELGDTNTPMVHDFAFDGLRGRVALLLDDGNVEVLDFV